MWNARFAALGSFFVLSACMGGGSELASSWTATGPVTVSGGVAQISLSDDANVAIDAQTSGYGDLGLFALVTGLDLDAGQVVARAGIENENVGAAVTTGSATFSGEYALIIAHNVFRTSTTISANQDAAGGFLVVNADFDAGTLTGTGVSTIDPALAEADLSFAGTISGTTLGGTVDVTHDVYVLDETITADLDGFIGADGVIGVFYGDDFNTAVTGGFIAE